MRRLFFAVMLIATPLRALRGRGSQEPVETFRFRFVGPQAGNRIASVAGVPGDVNTYYAGAASGGIFNPPMAGSAGLPFSTTSLWPPIGSLAVAPSNPSIVWGGNRRGLGDPRQRRDGKRDLQIYRCRTHVVAHGA
jgi:hypothetical protein